MTSITRVIKDLIDANTIAEIQEELANGSATVGITNVLYTDENFANTSNDYIANTSSHGHIKVLGYGFLPNANVVLSLVNERTNNEVLLEHSNTYYVNFKELRVEIENSNDLTYDTISLKSNLDFSNSFFNLFVINENGTNSKKDLVVKLERKSVTSGWFGGVATVTVDRVTFNNDTVTASVRGPLNSLRNALAATGNQEYGWFGGGSTGTQESTVERITFATDLALSSVRGPLSLARSNLAATGNDNFGWFGGGITVSRVDRITFVTDTDTALGRGSLSLARYSLAATGNDNFGWFGGGLPGTVTTIDRIDFAADNLTASVRGPLSLGRTGLAATGNQEYGWFGGGEIPSPNVRLTTVDRIDFADDTVTTSVRGPLSLARNNLAATGNDNFGWFGGGNAPGAVSIIDRIDFADDTATASVRGPLSLARSSLAATSGLS
jgi:hypothetical protein